MQDYTGDKPLSLSIAPDAKTFILGVPHRLGNYNSQGEILWEHEASYVKAVNHSADGSIIVAAFASGNIRWIRAEDGATLLDFYLHRDRKRWVILSPNGYYDCGSGGEELVGWHVNYGTDMPAYFLPAENMLGTDERPGIIRHILAEKDVAKGEALGNKGRGDNFYSTYELIDRNRPPMLEKVDPILPEADIPLNKDVAGWDCQDSRRHPKNRL